MPMPYAFHDVRRAPILPRSALHAAWCLLRAMMRWCHPFHYLFFFDVRAIRWCCWCCCFHVLWYSRRYIYSAIRQVLLRLPYLMFATLLMPPCWRLFMLMMAPADIFFYLFSSYCSSAVWWFCCRFTPCCLRASRFFSRWKTICLPMPIIAYARARHGGVTFALCDGAFAVFRYAADAY